MQHYGVLSDSRVTSELVRFHEDKGWVFAAAGTSG